jgi:hypothetical protein
MVLDFFQEVIRFQIDGAFREGEPLVFPGFEAGRTPRRGAD